MREYDIFDERCPKCNAKLREIQKDYYPEHIETENLEGFRHRYVCPKCGNEVIYNTIINTWTSINEEALYHYGKKGNRLLHKTSQKYLKWIQRNWDEIQEEYLEEICETGQVDGEELEELQQWAERLGEEEIILHLRQISDELSHPDYECWSQPTISAELLILTKKLEELLGE